MHLNYFKSVNNSYWDTSIHPVLFFFALVKARLIYAMWYVWPADQCQAVWRSVLAWRGPQVRSGRKVSMVFLSEVWDRTSDSTPPAGKHAYEFSLPDSWVTDNKYSDFIELDRTLLNNV